VATTKYDVGSCRAGARPGLGHPKGWPYTHDKECLPRKQEITVLQCRPVFQGLRLFSPIASKCRGPTEQVRATPANR
jgi:hypothetical protein